MLTKKTSDLVGTYLKLKDTGVRYKVYNLTDNKKAIPSDEPIAYLVLHKPSRRIFGSEQKFVSVPVNNLPDWFEIDPNQAD